MLRTERKMLQLGFCHAVILNMDMCSGRVGAALSDLLCPELKREQHTGFRRSKPMENSWRVSPLIGLPSLTRLPFEWISMIALSCSLRTPMFTT